MSAPVELDDAAPVVLQARELSRRFDRTVAVDALDLTVRRGECFGLLGPNGAGKSTTLKMLLGLLAPSGGTIDLMGLPVPACARQARQRVGVVPQHDSLDPDFTVAENLRVYGRYFGVPRAVLESRVDPLLEFAGLQGKRDLRIDALSGGMRRRLSLARALINDPELLFLDEPTTGLDPQARHLIWERLRQLLLRGKTIVLTTHFMDEAERLCSRLMIIDQGRRIVEGSPLELMRREVDPHVIEIYGEGARGWFDAHARGSAERVEWVGETGFLYGRDPARWLAALQAQPGLRYVHRPANLEDVFLKLTGRDLRD